MCIGKLGSIFKRKTTASKKKKPVVVKPPVYVPPVPDQGGTIIAADGSRTAPRLFMSESLMDLVPPPISPNIPADAIEGDVLVYQWTPDFNNTTGQIDWNGVNTRTTFSTLTSNPSTPLNVKLAEITAGMGLVAHRCKIQKAPSNASDWSTILWTGPKTAPAITSGANITVPEKTTFEIVVNTSEPSLVGIGGASSPEFERTTNSSAYLTQHRFRLLNNGTANYNAGQTGFALSFIAINKAGISSPTQLFSVAVANNPADDPATSGYDPALDQEEYAYEQNNTVLIKVVNAGAALGAIGAKEVNSGFHWFETYALDGNPKFDWWIPGLYDIATNSGILFSGNAYTQRVNGVDTYPGSPMVFGFGDRLMIAFDLNPYNASTRPTGRKFFVFKNGTLSGITEGFPIPPEMVNVRVFTSTPGPIGAKVQLNTGQFPPMGGVPTIQGLTPTALG